MIKSIKTGIILLAALLLAWLLPWCYAFVFASPSWSPFTLYSCVTHGFASVDFDRENNVAGRDLQGNTYTQQQFDSILPTFYYRQLAAEGRFPSEIEGVAVESRDVERTNFMFRTSPGEINRRRPTVYQLLESMPDRIDLEPATDVFRITGEGIEFVDMETNTIDQKKSAAFTKVLRDKGFSFPARVVSGNPSTRKRYDNGYLLVDDALRVYHMKQVRGRPFVRRTDVADSLQIGQIFVTEFADRKSLGFLVDSEKRFYTLGAEDYKLHEIPVGKFGPTRENMMIIGDMFYWTVTIQGAESKRYVAVNARDYSLADEYRPEEKPQAWAEYAKYLFPLRTVVHLAAGRLRKAPDCGGVVSGPLAGTRARRVLCAHPPQIARRTALADRRRRLVRTLPLRPAAGIRHGKTMTTNPYAREGRTFSTAALLSHAVSRIRSGK